MDTPLGLEDPRANRISYVSGSLTDGAFFLGSSGSTATFTFWLHAKTDAVFLEPDEPIDLLFEIWRTDYTGGVQASSELAVTLTDGPLPGPTGRPTAPEGLAATAGKGEVQLTWNAVDTTSTNINLLNDANITKHQVRQATDNDIRNETWTDIPNSAFGEVNATDYTVTGLADGTEYTFQVRAVNGAGNSDPATAVMVTPDPETPVRITGLTATAGNTTITLAWDDPDDAAIFAYDYQQRTGTQAFGEWTQLPDSSLTEHTHRFTDLTNGTAYTYRVRARARGRISLPSEPVTATPQGTMPAAIVLTATPRHGGVTLSWPNPARPHDRGIRVPIQDRLGCLRAVDGI